MREHIFVRPVRNTDTAMFLDWSINTKDNLFDPDVAKYPTTTVFTAFNRSGPIVFAPVQRPLMIDALAINPHADAFDVGVALKEITQAVVTQAYIENRGEIYFLCKEDSTIEIAKRHAYEEMPWRLFRIKVSELEANNENRKQSHLEPGDVGSN
jgi:hypothetical protein